MRADDNAAVDAAAQAAVDAETVQAANDAKQAAADAQKPASYDAAPGVKDAAVVGQKVAAEKGAVHQDTTTTFLANGVKQAQATGEWANARIDAANQQIAANHAAAAAANQRAAENTAKLADHETRIQSLESSTNAKFGQLKSEVDQNRKRASAGIAGVAAQANIPQVLESQTFSVGAGVGNTDGESALAVGFSARASQNVVVKAAVSNDTQHNFVVGAGVSYGW
ncbi:hypothetical protein GTB64_004439 [Salmonella enterica]|nr:hypothetical protein [Salmonella enterica]